MDGRTVGKLKVLQHFLRIAQLTPIQKLDTRNRIIILCLHVGYDTDIAIRHIDPVYYRLTPDICRILVDNFDDLSVWRFTESEFRKFKQVAVLGIRKPRGTELQDTLWLEELASAPMSIRSLAEMPEERYALPDHPIEVNTFKGERFNQKELEQQLRRCNSFAQMMARSELDSGVKRPLLPLSISQIGLIGGSGMINGLIACDTPHIIKGRIVKVIRTESEEKFSAQGNHIGSEVKETITNKMIFNVLTPNGFKALT